jgi:hypothetical protein
VVRRSLSILSPPLQLIYRGLVSVSNLQGEYLEGTCICVSILCMDDCCTWSACVCASVVHGCLLRHWFISVSANFFHYPYVLPLGEVMPNFSALCIPLGEVHACVCMFCGSNFLLYVYHWQATMVLSMSSPRISRYKKDAKEDMIQNNRRQIRCPCRSCKLERWINWYGHEGGGEAQFQDSTKMREAHCRLARQDDLRYEII